ncbi:MAG: hypothetical protein ACXW1Y_10015 [Acidimicrobiia bacterium]
MRSSIWRRRPAWAASWMVVVLGGSSVVDVVAAVVGVVGVVEDEEAEIPAQPHAETATADVRASSLVLSFRRMMNQTLPAVSIKDIGPKPPDLDGRVASPSSAGADLIALNTTE